jgi:hypothetical protein
MDNVIITEIVRRTKVFYGLAALGVGVVLGFTLRSLWRK